MMDVDVDYSHSFDSVPVRVLDVSSAKCDVIEVAEAVGLFLVANIVFEGLAEHAGVVTWRPHGTESVPVGTTHHTVAGIDDGARRL